MLSIKTVSPSASAERLAQQVQEDHTQFFEEQEDFAIKQLRQNGLRLIRGDSADLSDQNILIQTADQYGAVFWLQLRRDDEVRDALGYCLGCGLTLNASKKADCWLGCRNAAFRLYPSTGQSVPLKILPDRSVWTLVKKIKGLFLSLIHPDDPQKLKPASPKVIGILKR